MTTPKTSNQMEARIEVAREALLCLIIEANEIGQNSEETTKRIVARTMSNKLTPVMLKVENLRDNARGYLGFLSVLSWFKLKAAEFEHERDMLTVISQGSKEEAAERVGLMRAAGHCDAQYDSLKIWLES